MKQNCVAADAPTVQAMEAVVVLGVSGGGVVVGASRVVSVAVEGMEVWGKCASERKGGAICFVVDAGWSWGECETVGKTCAICFGVGSLIVVWEVSPVVFSKMLLVVGDDKSSVVGKSWSIVVILLEGIVLVLVVV